MKTAKSNFSTYLKSSMAMLALFGASNAIADVQFRVAYEASSDTYAVYMKPDSIPSPDMALSAQVTLVVPHGTGTTRFDATNLTSNINMLTWVNHSRIDAPLENPQADYLSFGFYYTGSTIPSFNWKEGIEQRIFTFRSSTGCSEKVELLDNFDPFNQLPNSANTNPGNDFTNVGWLQGYTGNYGDAITCPKQSNSNWPVKIKSPIGTNIPVTIRSDECAKLTNSQMDMKIQKLATYLNNYRGKIEQRW